MIKELKSQKFGKITENINLSKYTTYRLKGKGSVLVEPTNQKELMELLHYIHKNKL